MITRRGARDGWAAEVGYGDYETRQASLNGGLVSDRFEFDLGVSWLDSAGFPTRTTDDTDRGYDNLSANAQLRADVGRAEVALRHWRAEGTSEYSDFFLTPVDQDFETSTSALTVAWPVGAAARAQVTTTRLEDRIQQNQSPDYLRTRPRQRGRAGRLAGLAAARAQCRRDVLRASRRAASPTATACAPTPTR